MNTRILFITIAFVLTATSFAIASPTFDCSKAAGKVEQLICRDQPLAKLDQNLAEVYDFARDYLGLLKAAVIAAGIVPPGMEGAEQPLADLLARLTKPGHGLEIVSRVNGIPKGSRLAVSTTLLAPSSPCVCGPRAKPPL